MLGAVQRKDVEAQADPAPTKACDIPPWSGSTCTPRAWCSHTFVPGSIVSIHHDDGQGLCMR